MIAVTGATGFIGQELARRLDADGVHWRALVRSGTRAKERLGSSAADLVIGDLHSQPALTQFCDGAETVVHLAGAVAGLSRRDYFRTNADGTASLLRAAEASGVRRFVLVSSIAAAGPSGGCRRGSVADGQAPVTWYGESKLAAEVLLEGARIPQKSILRPSVVYGPGDAGLLSFFALARLGLGLRLAGADLCLSLIHVADCVDAISSAITCPEQSLPGRLCLAHPEPQTLRELSVAMIRAAGRRPRIVLPLPRWMLRRVGPLLDAWCRISGRPSLANGQKILEMTQRAWICPDRPPPEGWRIARIGVEEGFARTRLWYLRHSWL